jgi:glycosyltransferase involved in cell wall biosynthesis
MTRTKQLSVIVVVYDMKREAPRTLLSLSAAYQRGIDPDAYEVLVVENGSQHRLDGQAVESLGSQFRYFYIPDAKPSPASAVNFGLARAEGDVVCVLIDGARIATPGVLRHGLLATRLSPLAVVATLGFYLGTECQRIAVTNGYTTLVEDALLDSIDWPEDGYRLFEIGGV